MATAKTTSRSKSSAKASAPAAVAEHSHEDLVKKIAALEAKCAGLENDLSAAVAACAKATAACEAACAQPAQSAPAAEDPRLDELIRKLNQAFRHLRKPDRVAMPKF